MSTPLSSGMMQSSASSSPVGIDIYPPSRICFSDDVDDDDDNDSLPDLNKPLPPPKKKRKTKGGTNDATTKKYHSSLATPFSEKSQRVFTECIHLTINLLRAELELLDRIFGNPTVTTTATVAAARAAAAAASASPAHAIAEVSASDLEIVQNPEFELILLHVANTDEEISTTPCFITAMSAFCGSVDMMHEHITGDDDFARTALLVGINSGFFTKRNYGCMFSPYFVTVKKDRALIEADREAIKRRWMKLDDILSHIKRAYGGGSETTAQAARHFSFIAVAVYRVKRCLEDRLVRDTSEYLYPSRHSVVVVPSTKLARFDASFCINRMWGNNAVSRQLRTLVKNGDFEMFLPYSRPSANHNTTWVSEQAFTHVDRTTISVVSPLGIRWSHGDRVCTYRNCTLKNIASELVRALSKAADAAADRRSHTEYELAREVLACMKEAHRRDPQCIDDVKSAVKFPLRLTDKVAELCVEGDETLCVKEVRNKAMEWVTDSVAVAATNEKEGIKGGRRSWLVHKFVTDSALPLVTEGTNDEDFFKHLLKYCKADFTMDSIKTLMVSCIRGDAWLFVVEALIREFPVLANSWLDEQGNTLLGLCIIHEYANFSELLLNSRVKEFIDFPSIDGMTPLMIAADHATDISQGMASMLIVHGADLLVVNRNTETIFHRAACSNNVELLRMLYYSYMDNYDFSTVVDLRRACDGATALQIALVRGNCEVATCLMESFNSKTRTKFGKSKFLRTPEVMLLKNRQPSLAVLRDFGITPNIRLIRNSAIDHSLFEEESFVATTGLLNCGRICKISQIYGADKRQVITGALGALKSDDYSWTLLNIRNSDKYPWVYPLMTQKYEEVERILGSTDNRRQYNAEDCSICLNSFETTTDVARGITDCGHFFHESCWDSMLKYKCPMCRRCTGLTTLDSSVVHYDEEEPAQEPRRPRQASLHLPENT